MLLSSVVRNKTFLNRHRTTLKTLARFKELSNQAQTTTSPVDRLSPRERDVLGAMAEGKSNQGIAEALFITEAAVEKHVTNIFHKLELGPTPTEHRRVRAVLAYLDH